MKILKDAGSFEILTKTDDIIGSIARAARTCYQSQDKSSPENDIKLVKNLLTRGHEAMLEFADMTVKFQNCSRGMTHEMVRHRLCSFAQESTRYVDESDFEMVVPPHRDENEKIIDLYDTTWGEYNYDVDMNDWLKGNEIAYKSLRKAGWKPEDARQILPNALKSEIVVKCNMREWRRIFYFRCDRFAHWEIRAVMLKLLKYCKENIPLLFDDFYFFKTEDGQDYAKQVSTDFQIKEMLTHYCKSHNLTEYNFKLGE
jgi:thymidylate synthase (FAD)